VAGDPLLLTGIALALAGLAFKASVAPFQQWTPDVYEGAPTPVTAFMAVATKAAAFAIILRFFDFALLPARGDWDAAMAALAVASIAVGNAGAIGQDSLKRLLAYSSIAQAGYMLAGVVVGTSLGLRSVVFYLFVYLLMNVAAFAVVVARERETALGDDIEAVAGIGASRPALAWPLTISMLALAGFPGTVGFVGKFFLIEGTVDGGVTWLGVTIVVGSMVSLAYYLRVVAAVWMRPAAERVAPAPVIAVGIIPSPLLDLASDAAAAIFG
jgi:NADH-quinone oxidoreductase subunit N